jgi:hypothetical protein
MQIGLLWYDDTKDTVQARARKAAGAYLTKFGHWPDTCQVHADGQVQAAVCRLDDKGATLRIVPAPYILRDHFWIGENGNAAH